MASQLRLNWSPEQIAGWLRECILRMRAIACHTRRSIAAYMFAVAAEEAEVATRIKLRHDDILRDLIALRSAAAEAGQFAAAIRATEMLGRDIGMWPTLVESAHPDGTPGQQDAPDSVHTVVADVILILTNHKLNLPLDPAAVTRQRRSRGTAGCRRCRCSGCVRQRLAKGRLSRACGPNGVIAWLPAGATSPRIAWSMGRRSSTGSVRTWRTWRTGTCRRTGSGAVG